MRPSMSGRFDRQAIYCRETPARRLAVILSTLFLLSLSTVAAVTTLQAQGAGQDATRITIATLPTSAAH